MFEKEDTNNLIKMLKEKTKLETNVSIYYDKDGDSEIVLHFDRLVWELKYNICVCDLCNSIDDDMYFCPELGMKLLCSKCFKEHKRNVKWYVEDTHSVLNNLVLFIQNYHVHLNSKNRQVINDFFFDKGHSEFKIESFIKE